MSLTQISRGRNPLDAPSASFARLDPVQLRLVFRYLPEVFERQRSLDPLAQVTAIKRYPSPQSFGAILFHQ